MSNLVNWLLSKMSLRSVSREHHNAFCGSRTHHVKQSILPTTVGAGVSTISILHSRRQTEVKTWRKEIFWSEILMFSDILWLNNKEGHITGRTKSGIFFSELSCTLLVPLVAFLLHLSLRCSYFCISFIQSPRSDKNQCLFHLYNQKYLAQCLETVSKWTFHRD